MYLNLWMKISMLNKKWSYKIENPIDFIAWIKFDQIYPVNPNLD